MDLWKDAKILMEDVKRRKEIEMLEERQFWAEIENEERERKAVIESERRRMLMEHARYNFWIRPLKICFGCIEKQSYRKCKIWSFSVKWYINSINTG